IPPAVIRHASRELSRLEALGAPTPQLDLFAEAAASGPAPADIDYADDDAGGTVQDERLQALVHSLDELDPDQMSPREALEALYRQRAEHLSTQISLLSSWAGSAHTPSRTGTGRANLSWRAGPIRG